MPSSPRFNYIITIHNKQDLIEQVLHSVLMCCRDGSRVYPVLDGCTDQSETIIDRLVDRFAGVPITKVHTPDVHELLSINAGLRAASHEGHGYNIVLQDDVVLADFHLERKIAELYRWAGPQLGYLSLRLGANFTPDAATSDATIPLTDFAENAYGHGLPEADVLMPGHLAYRTVPIKSPVCIPFELIRSIGLLEERLAPYAHDDTEYAIRSTQAGYRNAVFAMRFYSDLKWGGTRESPHPRIGEIQRRNIGQIRQWHRAAMEQIAAQPPELNPIAVPGMCDPSEHERAMAAWEAARRQVSHESSTQAKILKKMKSLAKGSFLSAASQPGAAR